MKTLVKKIAHMLLGEYSAYYIYTCGAAQSSTPPSTNSQYQVTVIDESTLARDKDPFVREQSGYAGWGAYAYACIHEERITGICFYWAGERYLQRNFWPLAEGEAKLVQIVVHPDMRGRGLGSLLVSASFHDMVQKGYTRAYARIWHSNTPSLRAFERAGWTKIALVFEINPLRRRKPFRLTFAANRSRNHATSKLAKSV